MRGGAGLGGVVGGRGDIFVDEKSRSVGIYMFVASQFLMLRRRSRFSILI